MRLHGRHLCIRYLTSKCNGREHRTSLYIYMYLYICIKQDRECVSLYALMNVKMQLNICVNELNLAYPDNQLITVYKMI